MNEAEKSIDEDLAKLIDLLSTADQQESPSQSALSLGGVIKVLRLYRERLAQSGKERATCMQISSMMKGINDSIGDWLQDHTNILAFAEGLSRKAYFYYASNAEE